MLLTRSRLHIRAITPLPQRSYGKLLDHKGTLHLLFVVSSGRHDVTAHESALCVQHHMQVPGIRPYSRHLPTHVFGRARQATMNKDQRDRDKREKEEQENE